MAKSPFERHPLEPSNPDDPTSLTQKIENLVQQLSKTEAELQALTAGQIDAVINPISGQPILLSQAQAQLRTAQADLSKRVSDQANELAHNNYLLQSLIETMPVGAIIADADGTILHTNATGQQILGTSVKGSVESPIRPYTIYYPDGSVLLPEDFPLMHALKEGRGVYGFEILVRKENEEEITILVDAVPIKDQNKQVISGIALFQDISERKKSRQALQNYADRLKILHQADEVILSATTEREIVTEVLPLIHELLPCQRASVLTFDWKKGEAIVQGILHEGILQPLGDMRLPVEDQWSLEKLAQAEMHLVENLSDLPISPVLQKVLHSSDLNSFICVPLVAHAELIGVLNLAPNDPKDLISQYAEEVRQISDQLAIGLQKVRLQKSLKEYTDQLEENVAWRTAALRASEARFRTVFEDSVFGIALIDESGKFIETNLALQRMCGYDNHELIKMTVNDPVLFARNEQLGIAVQSLVSGESNFYQQEEPFRHKNGKECWWRLTISRVQPNEGIQSRLMILTTEDITEKRSNQEALIHAERLSLAGRLGASLAHEINNPLQSVIGCLGLAEEMLEENNQVRGYLDIAMEELERAAKIVHQLRDLSRPTNMKDKQPVDLNVLIDKVLLLTRKIRHANHIELIWNPKEGLPMIPLVAESIQQVCINLVLNAVAAMPEGGQLEVKTCQTYSPEGVQLTIKDTGTGIEPAQIERIFEPFYSTRPEGLGLGLFISKKIIEQHDGEIEVESTPANGTTFQIWLPT